VLRRPVEPAEQERTSGGPGAGWGRALMTQLGHGAAFHVAVLPVLSKHSGEPIRCRLMSQRADMRRREFLGVLCTAAAGWPLAAHAQQPEPMRRISVLVSAADDPDSRARITAFVEVLKELGWTDGPNIPDRQPLGRRRS